MFGFNIIFWVKILFFLISKNLYLFIQILGFMIGAIGIYAWIEKDTFDNFGRLTMGGTLFFDPALVFVLVGIFMFCIGFTGCVGSLRENTCLLLFVRNILFFL
jgi:tetraspanin-5